MRSSSLVLRTPRPGQWSYLITVYRRYAAAMYIRNDKFCSGDSTHLNMSSPHIQTWVHRKIPNVNNLNTQTWNCSINIEPMYDFPLLPFSPLSLACVPKCVPSSLFLSNTTDFAEVTKWLELVLDASYLHSRFLRLVLRCRCCDVQRDTWQGWPRSVWSQFVCRRLSTNRLWADIWMCEQFNRCGLWRCHSLPIVGPL